MTMTLRISLSIARNNLNSALAESLQLLTFVVELTLGDHFLTKRAIAMETKTNKINTNSPQLRLLVRPA